MLSLRELDNHTGHIDYVEPYMVDTAGAWHGCSLILAQHNQFRPVTFEIPFDEGVRVDLAVGQKTELVLSLPKGINGVQCFTSNSTSITARSHG